MSNETTQKRSLSVSLGAAFLMATSAIGPGFLTQTSQFTAKYLSSFAFVIVCVIIGKKRDRLLAEGKRLRCGHYQNAHS